MALSDKDLENRILEVLRKSSGTSPLDTNTVFSNVRQNCGEIDNEAIRNALWRLIARQAVEWTSDRHLKAAH